jgi:hypothetical protein
MSRKRAWGSRKRAWGQEKEHGIQPVPQNA